MSEATAEITTSSGSRPAGCLKPSDDGAASALAAIETGCCESAERTIASLSEVTPIEQAWKLVLRGQLAVKRVRFAEAEALLKQACSVTSAAGTLSEVADPFVLRLRARALHYLGWLHRRQDRPGEAFDAHLAAYVLRTKCGSFDELWQTAVELGMDAEVGRRLEDARRWYHIAILTAGKSSHEPSGKQAVAWTHLSNCLAEGGRCEDAVSAARQARQWWRRHDIGAASAARAELTLGSVLVKQGEMLCERNDRLAGTVLDEALKRLAGAREALLAFGPDYGTDAQLCLEQKDFAERLLASRDLG